MVPETQAAERRTWNSKPSEEMRVTNGDGVVESDVEERSFVVGVFSVV
jgi:hypothetical protein